MSKEPEVSVVMPCLNEEEALGLCIRKIKKVFEREGIDGEIVVVDNGSTDRSLEIAKSEGVVSLIQHKRGYGAAYLKGFKESRGKYIIMADSDNSYDFYDIPKFLKALRDGYDMAMGSRFKGRMRKGAMSWSHRYIGNPILSGMCRLFLAPGFRISTAVCGV